MGSLPSIGSSEELRSHVAAMRSRHRTGFTQSVDFRRSMLIKLKKHLKANEDRILRALQSDLGKAPFEGYATELGLVYEEINFCLKHVRQWARPKRVQTPIVHFPAHSKVYPAPRGVVLVVSPWNYPLQLALVPLVDALAAGNSVALKPSKTSEATCSVINEIISSVFDPEYVCCLSGERMNDWLLDVRWDQIFFTGSPNVGRAFMKAASDNLTPVVLELGGKSPCIVDETANIKRAAQRIAWGKGINAGQTCVAPDYALVHEAVVDQFAVELKRCFSSYYGEDALGCPEWPKMVNARQYERVCRLIDERNDCASVAFGGRRSRELLRIEPTCLRGVTLDDPVMGEEIFGPVLPIIEYSNLDEAFEIIRSFETPLACYVFSESAYVQQRVLSELQFGGATVNDVVIHLANHHMGFGGLGNSGMGQYHGKAGFDCFTHYKSVLSKATWLEVPVRTPPFRDKIKLLKLLMR